MNFLKLVFLFSLLFIQCVAMDDSLARAAYAPMPVIINPQIATILAQLKTKDASQTLQPEEFWTMMAESTGMGSCFFGEFIGNALESDICMIIKYLIQFGQGNTDKFYECITGCTGIDGITPLNELIRYIKSENSESYRSFSQLLNFIKTLPIDKRLHLFNQADFYGKDPITNAAKGEKPYIVRAIADILINPTATWGPGRNFLTFIDGTIIQL